MYVNLDSKKTNFVVVGGGTAGWITALLMRHLYPSINITLIESQEIGILGAGEGTVPQFVDVLEVLGISVSDLINHADATIKSGIKLVNWNGRGKNDIIFSNFVDSPLTDYVDMTRIQFSQIAMVILERISQGETVDDVVFNAKVCNANKVKFKFNKTDRLRDPVYHFNKLGSISVHFNAAKLANYLKTVGVTRNIKLVDGIIEKINEDKNGYITSFTLKDGTEVPSDFVFDCSGFHRLIIGKHYKCKWNSFKDYLPVNKAVPFFLPIDENKPIPPYTEAIAMKYGWMWKIPVRGRYGCGYVFDDRLIDAEQAKQEIREEVGNVDMPRVIGFEPGYYDTPWIKNCIAIGLSSGFVEPLEATSVHIAVITASLFTTYNNGAVLRCEKTISRFNKIMQEYNNDVLNYLQFHYLGKRTDTVFWKDFTKRNKLTPLIEKIIQGGKDPMHLLERDLITSSLYPLNLILELCTGLRFFDKEIAADHFRALYTGSRKAKYDYAISNLKEIQDKTVNSLIDHKDFLDYILKNK